VWNLRQRIGITRLADLTELDYLGIPVATAVRPNVDSVQVTATHGKGFNIAQALVSAIMEAAERWAASRRVETEIASTLELDRLNRRYIEPESLGGRLKPDELAEWIRARSVADCSSVLVPASDVVFPYFAPDGCVRPSRPCTSGLASGNSLPEAILHGIFEAVERSIVSTAWSQGRVHMIAVESLPEMERQLVLQIEKRGVRTIVCRLDNPILPVFTLMTFDDCWIGPHVAIGGHGAHLCERIALRRAITEAAQSRIVALQGSREDLSRHASKWDDYGQSGRSSSK
jgi:thioglycine synthase